MAEPFTLPMCKACNKAELLPLSDYGENGAAVRYKAWACPACGWNIRVDKGDITFGVKVQQGRR